MRKRLIILFLTIQSFIFGIGINNLKTKDLNLIYYSNSHKYIIPHLARCYERTWHYYQKFWDYTPYEKTSIFVEDFSDWSNGGATAVTNNFVYISMSPYMYVFEVAPGAERMSLLMHHELTHVMAMDMYSKKDYFFRKLFRSKIQHTADNPITFLYAYLTSPRKYAPRWYHEGIAVSMETWMGGGIGRAMGAYDEMVFRGMVKDNAHIYKMVGLEAEGTAIDFQVGANSYLYGTRFYGYLAYKYGPKKLVQWVKRDNNSKGFYASQFENVFHKNLEKEWDEWIRFEKDFQKKNLERIRKYPITKFNPVKNSQPLGSVSRSYLSSDGKKIYVGIKSPGQLPNLCEIDIKTGEKRKLCNIKGAFTYYTTNLVYLKDEEKIVFTTDNFYRRDLNIVDIKSKKNKLLIKDIRAGELALNKTDKSIWAVRHENGISTIIRIPYPYEDWKAVFSFDYGKDIYDLDISPDGSKMSAAVTLVNGNQKLIYLDMNDLEKGQYSEHLIYDFDYSSPANFVFSDDGRYLYGSSYYSGVSNIYRYDFDKNDMSILSNAETGFFRPLPINKDSLLVYNYVGGKGWQPGFIKQKTLDNVNSIVFLGQKVYDKYPYIKNWTDGSPAKINLQKLITYEGPFSFIKSIKNKGSYPIVEGYKNYIALGYKFNYSDDLNFNRFDLSCSYIFDKDINLDEKERLHLKANYHYQSFNLRMRYNNSDFYDIFGPTKVSKKGYSLGMGYSYNLIYDKPKTMNLFFDIDTYRNLENLPSYQNISSSTDKMSIASVKLKYKFFQNSLGNVDDEQGVSFSNKINLQYIEDEVFPKISSDLHLGYLLPINHTSIFLRNYAGYGFGDKNNSYTNFYFGGFGNNYIDKKNEKRYRTAQSFSGVDLNAISGKSYLKNMLELNLPPIRFKEIGNSAFYMRWIRTSIFTSLLNTNLEDNGQYYYNVGIQTDLRVISMSFLKTTFSLGYSFAWDENKKRSKEFMISLKIL